MKTTISLLYNDDNSLCSPSRKLINVLGYKETMNREWVCCKINLICDKLYIHAHLFLIRNKSRLDFLIRPLLRQRKNQQPLSRLCCSVVIGSYYLGSFMLNIIVCQVITLSVCRVIRQFFQWLVLVLFEIKLQNEIQYDSRRFSYVY